VWYGDGTDHVFESGEKGGYSSADENGANPAAYESFHCLFGRQTDERGATPDHAADVCEDVVGDD